MSRVFKLTASWLVAIAALPALIFWAHMEVSARVVCPTFEMVRYSLENNAGLREVGAATQYTSEGNAPLIFFLNPENGLWAVVTLYDPEDGTNRDCARMIVSGEDRHATGRLQ